MNALNTAGFFLHADVPRIAVGGPASGAINASAVNASADTAKRVVLRYWGFNGAVVRGRVNANSDTF